MKKFIKQTLGYSLVAGVVSLMSPVAVSAADVTKINLYGIDTSRIATVAQTITSFEAAIVILSIITGIALIVNGKLLKKNLK